MGKGGPKTPSDQRFVPDPEKLKAKGTPPTPPNMNDALQKAQSMDERRSRRRERQFLLGAEHRQEEFGPDHNNDPNKLQKELDEQQHARNPQMEPQEEELHQLAENERVYNFRHNWRDGQKRDRDNNNMEM